MQLDPALTLALWEQVVGRPPAVRDHVLLDPAPATLSARNVMALQRYTQWFGSRVELLGRCPQCSAAVEFTVDAAQCVAGLDAPEPEQQWHELVLDGESLRFRLPAPADVHALADLPDAEAFATALLERCVSGTAPTLPEQREAVCRAIETRMPSAGLHFAMACPECDTTWSAPLEPVDLLWRTLRERAEHLLAEVAALARHLGWSERDILSLSPTRRAAYLQLVGA